MQFYQRMKESDVTELFLWEERLAPLLGYLPPEQVARVREALSLAYDAHASQKRKSGEPFITHPVEVTRILAKLQMDWESLAAGLLHDTVEDCGDMVGLEEIGFHFGPAVRRIVEGETKFSKLPTHHPERAVLAPPVIPPPPSSAPTYSNGTSINSNSNGSESERNGQGSGASAQIDFAIENGVVVQQDSKAQDLQFLFLAMTEEVRVIVVKLADRLHNMRTMGAMPPGKQRRIAQETLTVFAPLARLLGLYVLKEELEELSFKFAMPQQHAVMRKTIGRLWEHQRQTVQLAAKELQSILEEDAFLMSRIRGLKVNISRKALYGTWRKLQESGKSVRDISKIAQLQIVLEPLGTAPSPISKSSNGSVPPSDAKQPHVPPILGDASDRQLCYHVMGLVHARWAPIPGSMKDYIATPKPNNYQSLHTTVVPTGLILPDSKTSSNSLFPIEVQIRTAEMERLARYGIAVESWSCADYVRSAVVSPNSNTGSSAETLTADDDSSFSKTTQESRKAAWSPFGIIGDLLNPKNASAVAAPSTSRSVNNNEYPKVPVADRDHMLANGGSRPPAKPETSIQNGRLDPQTMSRRINWLNSIRLWQEEFVGTLTAQEFVACVTDDILGQGVFVFTPSGQVMRLPKGATVVDFAYHIHTDIGNTMVAAKVNGKVVPVDHELANAEVVEVITYKGPVNATIIKRHQGWFGAARTKTARHKIAKFLREHAALAAAAGLLAPGDSALGNAQRRYLEKAGLGGGGGVYDPETPQVIWLLARCEDRQGLLADIANVISRHGHNIRSYSGSVDRDAALFIMEYELEGYPDVLPAMCEDLSGVQCVLGWAVGCALPSALRS